MAMKKGQTIFIESKEEKDKLSPLQEQRIKELIADGFIAFCLKKGKGIIFGSQDHTKQFEKWIT